MTDREKLIEILKVPIYPHLDADPADVVADYLMDNGVTFATDINVGGKWISVEDGLPEDEKPVLVYYGFRNNSDNDLAMMFMGALSYFVFDPHPHWQHTDSGLIVTHWMPLPEPPENNG